MGSGETRAGGTVGGGGCSLIPSKRERLCWRLGKGQCKAGEASPSVHDIRRGRTGKGDKHLKWQG